MRLAQCCSVGNWRRQRQQLISPQMGEMSGRIEGGAVELGACGLALVRLRHDPRPHPSPPPSRRQRLRAADRCHRHVPAARSRPRRCR
ncbi:hypothetical protein EB234_08270 [Mesorhizobium japonicum R7A]|nr:hypothetical protein EB234_08270 [Mesorhizobium japonicum R7A]